MCIIVAKPKGKNLPAYDTLRNCWRNNSDGAGIMWAVDGKVHWVKGLMTWEDFVDEIYSLDERLPIVMHFRITTSGGTCPECTHPFPVSSNGKKLKKLRGKCNIAMAHNGIIDGMKTDDKAHISDTMAFVMKVVSPMRALCPDFTSNDDALTLLENVADSKLCFLEGTGDITTLGNFIEDCGCLYSNSSYQYDWYAYTAPKRWNSYNWDKWDETEDKWDETEDSVSWDNWSYLGDLTLEEYRAYLPFDECLDCHAMDYCAFERDEPYCTRSYTASGMSMLDYIDAMEKVME